MTTAAAAPSETAVLLAGGVATAVGAALAVIAFLDFREKRALTNLSVLLLALGALAAYYRTAYDAGQLAYFSVLAGIVLACLAVILFAAFTRWRSDHEQRGDERADHPQPEEAQKDDGEEVLIHPSNVCERTGVPARQVPVSSPTPTWRMSVLAAAVGAIVALLFTQRE